MSRTTPKSLVGHVVAITGGARGIGRATADALLAQGCRVAIGDIDEQLVVHTATELGRGAVGLPVDVTQRASFAAFLTEVERRLGPLDVLVNNAGIMPVGPFVQETDEVAARMIDINLHGVILGSKLALERFLPRRSGHLVNVASSAGKSGFPGGATYCATKHAVVGLSETIRSEVRDDGINVSIVMPILVNTELGNGFPEVRGFKQIEPEDVAGEIVDALRLPRVDVYVPRRVGPVLRSQQVLPRRFVDWFSHVLRGDQVLAKPDRATRAAYEARIGQTHSSAPGEPSAEAGADQPAIQSH